jgi:ribose transport system substrate-binding protein
MTARLRRRHRLGIGIAAALCATLVLSACGAGGNDTGSAGDTKKIFAFGYFPRNYNFVTQEWSEGFDQAKMELGDRYDVELQYEGTLDTDPGRYLNFIRTSMVQQPDGIVVIPNNSTAMTQGLTQLQSQYRDVKILVMDQPVPNFNPVSYVGTENEKAGAQAAEWMIDEHNTGKLESNKVAVFRNAPGSASTDARLKGFLDAIKGTDLTVIKTVQPPDIRPATSARMMADVLVANPDLGAVFSVSDTFGVGAAQAIVKAKSPAKQVSIDASAEAVQAIIDGKGMQAAVAQHFSEMGHTAVMTLADALEGKSVEPIIDTGTTVVIKSNASDFLKTIQ